LGLDGIISGPGALAKDGDGGMHLTQANTYSGGTQIRDGAIYALTTGALGTGPVLVDGPGADLQFFSGVSAGNLTITVDGGRVLFATGSTAGSARVINQTGGTVRFGGAASAGRAELENVDGTIYFGDNTAAGQATIINHAGGSVDLSLHRGPLVIGSLSGAGSLFLGSNTLILGGNNASSALEGSLHDGGEVAGAGGGLTKAGTGTLELTGDSTYTGETLVEAGTLKVNGSLVSPVRVAADAVLGGSGKMGGILAQSGSTIAPGNSIGSLNVSGNVAFAAGSNYAVEINAAGQSDRIDAAGSATLSGGTVYVLPDQGTGYKADSSYTIMTARGGVTGTFAGTAGGEFAFVTPTLRYTSDAVTLTLVRKVEPQPPTPPEPPLPEPPTPPMPTPPEPPPLAFHSVAETRNQYTTADGVEALGAGHRLYDIILGASVAGARQAFDALSGEAHASAASVAYEDGRLVREAILTRLRQPLSSSLPTFVQGSYSAAYAADRSQAPQPVTVTSSFDPGRSALWGEGFGSWGQIASNGNAASLETSTGGFILGADALVTDTVRLGVAGGFTRTSFDVDGRLSSGSNDSVFGAFYGSSSWGNLNLRLGASYAWHDFDVSRTIRFPGFADRTHASYDGWTAQAFAEVGYRMSLGRVQLEPFAGASLLRLHTDGFAEEGGAAGLTGSAQDQDLATTTLGLRAAAQLSVQVPLIARGLLGWRHAFGDVEPTTLLAFAGGASAFTVAGAPIDRDALVAEAGLDWQTSEAISLGVSYSGQIGERAQEHVLKGNLTWRFSSY
jgi:outer membrane autotransporter protein